MASRQNVFVAEFMGYPKINILQGTVVDDGGIFLRLDSMARIPLGVLSGAVEVGEKVSVGIRPESISLKQQAHKQQAQGAQFEMFVDFVEHVGAGTNYFGRIGGDEFRIALSEGQKYQPGDPVRIGLAEEQLHFFGCTGGAPGQTSNAGMKRKLLVLPVDARPVVCGQLQYLLQLADWDIALPPTSMLGRFRQSANHERLGEWLMERAGEVDGFVLSLDTLLYGGLVASRISPETADEILTRAEWLETLNRVHPAKPIYGFLTTLRIFQQQHQRRGKTVLERLWRADLEMVHITPTGIELMAMARIGMRRRRRDRKYQSISSAIMSRRGPAT